MWQRTPEEAMRRRMMMMIPGGVRSGNGKRQAPVKVALGVQAGEMTMVNSRSMLRDQLQDGPP
jgi:hypothetical protein